MDINSFRWLHAITDAEYGDFGEMIRLLRSDALIPDEIERKLRMTLARMLAGDFKRRGRPNKLKCIPAMRPVLVEAYAWHEAFILATRVEEITDELRAAGKPSTKKAALAWLAARRGIAEESVMREYRRAIRRLSRGKKTAE